MELWRPEADSRPTVLNRRNLAIALGLHVACFVGFYLFAVCHGLFEKEEEIIPIDLSVVVVENLDGKPDEPPPLKKPDPPPPPPPKPRPKPPKPDKPKQPDKPKALEQIVTNVTVKVDKKKEEQKKPAKPEKSQAELLKERMAEMRKSATLNKPPKTPPRPQPNGRTDRKTLTDAEIQKLLNAGYKPGASTNLAASDEQLGFSLIKGAFEEKWDTPPWTDTLKPMVIRVWFGGGGRILKSKIEQSSGDAKADASLRAAASRVGSIPALPASFIEKYSSSGVPVRFTVKPQ